TIKKLKRPRKADSRSRFVKLRPKQSLSRRFDISKPLKMVEEGHRTYEDRSHEGFYYEVKARFRIPTKVKKLHISVWYERGVWMMAEPEFKKWFGVSSRKVRVWDGRAGSNTVVVERKD